MTKKKKDNYPRFQCRLKQDTINSLQERKADFETWDLFFKSLLK